MTTMDVLVMAHKAVMMMMMMMTRTRKRNSSWTRHGMLVASSSVPRGRVPPRISWGGFENQQPTLITEDTQDRQKSISCGSRIGVRGDVEFWLINLALLWMGILITNAFVDSSISVLLTPMQVLWRSLFDYVVCSSRYDYLGVEPPNAWCI